MSFVVAIWPENGSDENQYDYALSNFQPDAVYVMGDHQCTNNILRDAPRAKTFDDLPDRELVVLAPHSSRYFKPTVSLENFIHPEEGVYVFGPNNLHLSEEDVGNRQPDHVVSIPVDTKDEMFCYMAYLITAWHRRYG